MKMNLNGAAAAALLAVAAIGVLPFTGNAAAAPGAGNPATEYCRKIGGRPFVKNTKQGEAGYCRLRNGRVVEEWKLFRDANKKRQPDRRRPQPIGAPNPAGVYCEEQGGLIRNRMTPEGEVGYCHLPGGRVIEEWEFFRQSQGE